MMRLFLKFEFGKTLKFFKTKTLAKVITSLLFLAVFVFVGMGIYVFFLSGFRYINVEAVEDIKLALTLFIYEVFLLVLSAIIIFSAMVSGVFNLFRADTNAWIMSSPKYTLLPKVVLIKSCISSALPTVIMFLPAVLAFNKVYDLNLLSLIFIMVSSVVLLVLLNAGTLLLLVFLGSLYHAISKKIKALPFSFKGFMIVLAGFLGVSVSVIWNIVADVDLVQLFKAENVDSSISVSTIATYFNTLPTHLFAMEIVHWQHGNNLGAIGNFIGLTLIAMFFVALWWKYSYLFYPLWQKFQEGSSQTSVRSTFSLLRGSSYQFTGSATMALFKKETLVSSRNFKGVLWFSFLLFIWLLQIGANIILGHNIQKYQPDISQKIILLQTIQFIIAVYFISSFTLRFAFPSFSVEKKTSWILGTAPLSFRKIFFGKYFFYVICFLLVGIIMGYLNSLVLGLTLVSASYSLLLLGSVIVFIVTLGLTLGVVFPNTETDDPEVISTSMSGLFFTALSLMYGGVSALVLYTTLTTNNFILYMLFISVSIFIIIATLYKLSRITSYQIFNK